MMNTIQYKILGHGFDYNAIPKREVIAIVDLIPMDDDRELLKHLPYVIDLSQYGYTRSFVSKMALYE